MEISKDFSRFSSLQFFKNFIDTVHLFLGDEVGFGSWKVSIEIKIQLCGYCTDTTCVVK